MLTTRAMFVVLVVGLLAGPAAAGPNAVEAEALFRDGLALMEKGQYAEACEAFKTSQELDASVNTLANEANCREKNSQHATAWGLFLEVERQTRGDKKQARLNKTAKERAAKLEGRLSYLTISVPDESRIDGLVVMRNGAPVDSGLWNRAIPVDGGEYVISGRAPGHEEWETRVSIAAENGKTTVDVPKFKEVKKLVVPEEPKQPPPDGGGPVDEPDDRLPVESPGMFTTQRKIAVGVAVVGVGGIVGGFLLGRSADDLAQQATDLCPSTPCDDAEEANSLTDRAESRALQGNIVLGVGAAAVVGAAVLWFLGGPDAPAESGVALAPTLSPTFAGLDVAVRF
jgi:hypothetical protein